MSIRKLSVPGREFFLDASAGVLSGLLYLSYALSFVFLAPIQMAFAMRGWKSGIKAGGFSFAVIASGHLARMFELKAMDLPLVAAGIVPPLLLILTFGFLGAKIKNLPLGARILVSSVVLSVIAAPLVMRAVNDKEFTEWLVYYMNHTLGGTGQDEGIAIEVRAAVESALMVIRSSFSAFILWMIAGNWWIGSKLAVKRLAREGSAIPEELEKLSLANIRIPAGALWPTLISWSALFAVLLTGTRGVVATVVWNLAVSLASLYAVQGIGILSHVLKISNASGLVRILAPLALIGIALSSVAGAITMIVLPILGITEVWLPYRNLKGALK